MPTLDLSGRSAQTHAVIDELVRVMRAHRRVVEKRIDGLGIHHSQHRMLMVLSHMGRTASQKDVAKALDVSPACVARTLKSLGSAGLIEKAEGADGRCREIEILPRGRQLIDDSIKTFLAVESEMFNGIPEEDVEQLIRTLARVRHNLSEMEKGEGSDVK